MKKFYLYKYFNLNENKNITRVKEILFNKEIYIPSLQMLNDPFEALLNSSNFAKTIVPNRDCGVLSFTTTPHNILMWSHYGSGHTGVVIKFFNKRKI